MSKDSLVKGTIILAGAAFIARFLGLIQRVPLQNMLGDEGMAHYGIAYNVYFLLLIVATAGIPSALSKLVSEKLALEQIDAAQRIYKAAIYFALSAGVIITALLYFGAPFYARDIAHNAQAALSIQALAPAMLLFPLIAIMRGYFQGRQQMMPGGLSQIVEQILRVLTAVILAYLLIRYGYHLEVAAAGASFGGVMGAAGAFAVMLYFQIKMKRSTEVPSHALKAVNNNSTAKPLSYRSIYVMIFKLSIPISIISIMVPFIYFIDSSIVIPLLQDQIGKQAAIETLGILTGRAQSLAGIPPIMAIALSMSIVPVVSSAYARKDIEEVKHKASQALRISVISGLPLVLALSVAARPINGLLFTDLQGTDIMIWLTLGSMFQIMMMTSASILMGLGHTKAPMINVAIGIAVKLIGSFALSPLFGVYGIIWSTSLCFIVTMALNLHVLRKIVSFTMLGKRWPGVIITAILLSGAGVFVEHVLFHNVSTPWPKVDYLINGALTGAIVLLLYPLLLFVTKAFKQEDLAMLPNKIRKMIDPLIRKIFPEIRRDR